jgi:hypothetical protein
LVTERPMGTVPCAEDRTMQGLTAACLRTVIGRRIVGMSSQPRRAGQCGHADERPPDYSASWDVQFGQRVALPGIVV